MFTLTDYRVKILVASGKKMDTMRAWFQTTLSCLAQETGATTEPLMNIVATYHSQRWILYVFPRAKHRPACYYAEGEQKLTISPAGIDLTGVLVVPDPTHFVRVTAADVAQIYTEITLDR